MTDRGQEDTGMGKAVPVYMEQPITTRLSAAQVQATLDLPLWFLIEETTKLLSFNNYRAYMDYVLCGHEYELPEKTSEFVQLVASRKRSLPFTDADAYRLLKTATEAFLAVNCGVVLYVDHKVPGLEKPGVWDKILGDVDAVDPTDIRRLWFEEYLREYNGTAAKTLPYLALIRRKLRDWPLAEELVQVKFEEQQVDEGLPTCCDTILRDKLSRPCLLELIWSYWHEQGMLVQTMNAISRRFQNIRGPVEKDPLAMLELDPLRPLNNLLWGYIQDEQHRLSLVRRAYEYDHHYGLTLDGKAVPPMRPADSRSKFLEAFHNLLYLCSGFFKRDDDTTVRADAFPVLVALRDVHMLLTEGAHNQFGDLPATARIEMLMQQWLLARPEFREVLPTRIMVDYPEPWMDRVDAMKRLQGWTDTNVRHFHDLGYFGEQILLTIRFGNWNEADRDQAKVWARYWRHSIQNYIYAYRIATGVDLTADVTQPQQRRVFAAQPSVLLRQRLPGATQQLPLPAPTPLAPSVPRFRERRAARK